LTDDEEDGSDTDENDSTIGMECDSDDESESVVPEEAYMDLLKDRHIPDLPVCFYRYVITSDGDFEQPRRSTRRVSVSPAIRSKIMATEG
jgi:hypothetical protein